MDEGVGGSPAVGNVLGFSLLFRDRRALLRLEQRTIGPGVRLEAYEAEIPGVTFPMQAPTSTTVFRNRRCRATALTLQFERTAVLSALTSRLCGHEFGGLLVQDVQLDLHGPVDARSTGSPSIALQGRGRDGRFAWVLLGLQLVPHGRLLLVRAIRSWSIGSADIDLERLWTELGWAFGTRTQDSSAIVLDPVHEALSRPFVESGWKAPDLSSLKLHNIEVQARVLSLTLSAEDGPAPAAIPSGPQRAGEDQVRLRIDRARAAVTERRLERALEILDDVRALVEQHEPATIAVCRWQVELTRHRDEPEARKACVAALRRWLELRPTDGLARRLLVEQLALGDGVRELARLTRAMVELAKSDRHRARLELALGGLWGDKFKDRATARALLEPLVRRTETEAELAALRVPALLALCRSQAEAPRQAAITLRRVLELVHEPDRRVAAVESVVEALLDHEHLAPAVALLRQLDPNALDEGLLERAFDLAERNGDEAALRELSRLASTQGGSRSPVIARRVALTFQRARDRNALPALEHALALNGEDAELLEAAAEAAEQAGSWKAAASYLERLRAARSGGPRPAPSAEGAARRRLESESVVRRRAELDSDSGARRRAELDADSGARRRAELDADSGARRRAELDADSGARRRAELDLDPGARRRAELDIDPSARRRAELESESVMRRRAELESESVVRRRADIEADPGARRRAELESESAVRRRQGLDAESGPRGRGELESESVMRRRADLEGDPSGRRRSEVETDAIARRRADLESESGPRRRADFESDSVVRRRPEPEPGSAGRRQGDLELGSTLRRPGRPVEAEPSPRSDDLGDDAMALELRRAVLFYRSGDRAAALAVLEPLLQRAPERIDPALLEAASRDVPIAKVLRWLHPLAESSPSRAAALAMERAARSNDIVVQRNLWSCAARWADDPREALRALARTADPSDPSAWAHLADAASMHHAPDEEAAARRELGLRLLVLDRVDEAVAALERGHALEPADATMRLALAVAWERAERWDDAARAYAVTVAAEVMPSPLDPRLGLPPDLGLLADRAANLYAKAGAQRHALRLLRIAIKRLEGRGAARLEAAERMLEIATALRASHDTAEAALVVAEGRSDPGERASVLMSAANTLEPAAAVALLDRALAATPEDDRILDAILRGYEAAGRPEEGIALLQRRAHDSNLPPPARASTLRRLIERVRSEATDALVQASRALLQIDEHDVDALLVVADDEAAQGRADEAVKGWAKALLRLPESDPRTIRPAIELAADHLRRREPDRAKASLLRALAVEPGHEIGLQLLAAVADELDDPTLQVQANAPRLERAADAETRARLSLTLAAAYRRLGRPDDALARYAEAVQAVEPGSPRHRELAESWVELTGQVGADAQARAIARAELRRAFGRDLSASHVRTEARLWAEELGEPARALELLEEGLRLRPTDDLLLSSYKALAVEHGDLRRYLELLTQAARQLDPADERDGLLVELATTAAELEDAATCLFALDRMSSKAMAMPEMLDLRAWAVRSLGREDAELLAATDRLRADPDDAAALARLRRTIDDDASLSEHLLDLIDRSTAPGSMALVALRQARAAGDMSLLRRALRETVRQRVVVDLHEPWSAAAAEALRTADETSMADLVQIADEATARGLCDLSNSAEELLDAGLASLPEADHLHRLAWSRAGGSSEESRVASLRKKADRLAHDGELDERGRARLYVGMSESLDTARAVALLAEIGAGEIDRPRALAVLLGALERRGGYAEMVRLLEQRFERAREDDERVGLLKRLAHVQGELMGDRESEARRLRAALDIAPRDPDLLLPLLDLALVGSDANGAVDLAERVLDHVPMGEAAYLALAHRVVDVAMAGASYERAAAVLRRAATRVPGDRRTQERLGELEAMQEDPALRVGWLRSIAERQTGQARVDALEERARLLIDPLGRIDEAIKDLEAVLVEVPGRVDAERVLADLYERTGRWMDLVRMLESEFPRQHGPSRARTLRRIAQIYRQHLLDLARAEQALRLALDHLGQDPEQIEFAEELRRELVGDLEAQGRFVDLSIYLEQELTAEIDGRVEPNQVHPRRAELLIQLARIYRGPLDDEDKAARIYERLEWFGRLPDEGLATLARAYHRHDRHEDLVRILAVRSRALRAAGEIARKAAVDQRIAELLEGPLRRPHEAAKYYVDAYLANPRVNVTAGARARVLLAGIDAVVNVRQRLLDRLPKTPIKHRPALLTLLGEVLAPHEDFENEAEGRFREALALDPEHAPAREALGRLLAREGKLEAAVEPLIAASRHPEIEPSRAAEDAAIAARALLELDRPDQAERVLKDALQRAPESQRALLELARLYDKQGRHTEEAIVLENLSELALPSLLAAEVSFRRAMLLRPAFEHDPWSPEAERGRAYLLESVSADAKHVAARQTLLELATSRHEWSVVAHMHYLAIRELQPGPARAVVHLDLAETYLDRLDDVESAMRNLESAVQQAPGDLVITRRAGQIAGRMPEPARAAERFERIAAGSPELDDAARARLWLMSADLRMKEDDPAAAEAASKRVLDLGGAPVEAAAEATRNLETLAEDDARDLRQQKSGLLKLLDVEDTPAERIHILARLLEIGQSLTDVRLVEWASRQQIDLALSLESSEQELDAAVIALRDALAERGAYRDIVELYERLAERTTDPLRKADALYEVARLCAHGLRERAQAVAAIRRAVELGTRRPDDHRAEALLAEVVREGDDVQGDSRLYAEVLRLPAELREGRLALRIAALALRVGEDRAALTMARSLVEDPDGELRFDALALMQETLGRIGQPADRLPWLQRHFDLCCERDDRRTSAIALELAFLQQDLGDHEGAAQTCHKALALRPDDLQLLGLAAQLHERREQWGQLASVLRRLAALSAESREKAELHTKAARMLLDHLPTDSPAERSQALAEARQSLALAAELDPRSVTARAALLPLSFGEGRWDEVLELGVDIRALVGDDEAVLILPALCEAFKTGARTLAREVGFRHDKAAHGRYLYPGLRQLLGELSSEGPLPRLDAVLAAGSALAGGRTHLHHGLRAWMAGRPMHAGLLLGLARLAEADGQAEQARNLYQLAGFLSPRGPVPNLVSRLPPLPAPPELDVAGPGPLDGRSFLRVLLVRLRLVLSGLPGRVRMSDPPNHPAIRTRLQHVDAVLGPWRSLLGLSLPIAWSNDMLPGGVGIINLREPAIALGTAITQLGPGELRYRLASSAVAIAMGLAALEDSVDRNLVDLLDALGCLVDASHRPSSKAARTLAEALLSRRASSAVPTPDHRAALANELSHWLTQPGGLERLSAEFRRARLLLATRLSGHLDAALGTLRHDRDGLLDPVATLRTQDAQWLLRSLALY